MSDFNWLDVTQPFVGPAVTAYKNRHAIQHHWTKLLVALGTGQPNVIVTGRPGAGKSVLASGYHGEANTLDWRIPEPSTDVEVRPITIGEWTKIVHVIPGQDTRERAAALDLALNKTTDLDGIIHVVDWGYTSIRNDTISNSLIDNGIDSVEKLRTRNLSLEIEEFKLLADKVALSISNGRGPKWIVVAVNKIDLYHDKLNMAKRHYHPDTDGDFSAELKKLINRVGSHNLKTDCLPVCAFPEQFSWNGETVNTKFGSIMEYKDYLRSFVNRTADLQTVI